MKKKIKIDIIDINLCHNCGVGFFFCLTILSIIQNFTKMKRNRPRKRSGNKKYEKATSITNSRLVFIKMTQDKIKHDHIWNEIRLQFDQLSAN